MLYELKIRCTFLSISVRWCSLFVQLIICWITLLFLYESFSWLRGNLEIIPEIIGEGKTKMVSSYSSLYFLCYFCAISACFCWQTWWLWTQSCDYFFFSHTHTHISLENTLKARIPFFLSLRIHGCLFVHAFKSLNSLSWDFLLCFL